MLLGELLSSNRSSRPAIVFEGQTLSYADLDDLSNRFAHLFARLDLAAGDRVSMLMGNEPLVVAAYFGMFKSGQIANPINNRLTAEEVAYILGHAGSKLLITTPEFLETACDAAGRLEEPPAILCMGEPAAPASMPLLAGRLLFEQPVTPLQRGADDENASVLLIYTSGTTGRPKGVLLTHANVLADARALSEGFGLTPEHTTLCFMPLFHCNALIVSHMSSFVAGGTVVLCRRFSASRHWDLVKTHNVNSFSAPPTVLAILLEREAEVRGHDIRLDYVKVGSAPLTLDLAERFEQRFGRGILVEGWGLTEATATNTLIRAGVGGTRKVGSVGIALPGHEIGVVDENGRPVPTGQSGELVIRGPTVMKEYFRDPEATARAVVNGSLHTGDLGYMDDEGYVFLVGRKKEMIIRGGENISPLEVEEVLTRHPAVLEVAVAGLPDRIWGETVAACIVRNGTVSEDELIAFCSTRLAAFKVPAKIAFVEALPRNAIGKVLRRSLGQHFTTVD